MRNIRILMKGKVWFSVFNHYIEIIQGKRMKKIEMTIPHHEREVSGRLTLPEKEGKYPLVIFSHGYNGSKNDFEIMTDYLAQQKIASFCYDFCGGSVQDKSSLPTTQMTIFTEKEDLHAVVNALCKREELDSKNLFLFGGSQGGLVSALTAEEIKEKVRGLILLFPALCIAENWNERFPKIEDIPDTQELWGMTLGRVFFESIHGFDVYAHIGTFDKNVFVMHGDKDPVVSVEYSERLRRIYKNMEIEVFSGEGHGFTEAGNKKAAKLLAEFIKKNIVQ